MPGDKAHLPLSDDPLAKLIYMPLKDPGEPAAMTNEELLRALRTREVDNDELSQMQLTLIYGMHGEGLIAMQTRIKDGICKVYWRMKGSGSAT